MVTENIDNVMLKQIAEIEQKDEAQVLAELAGEQLAEMVYTVTVYDRRAKREVTKARLSWAGTKEVARSRGNILLSEPVVTELPQALRFMVKATDLRRNFTVFGGCQQPYRMKVNDVDKVTGEITGHHYEDDPYYFQKGLSKCQRNALTLCIPADYAARCITRFLKASGTKAIPQEARPRKSQPAKSEIKPREEWDKITQDQVPDFPALEPIIWSLCKLQPIEMYRELGVNSRADMTITAWEAFLTLKQIIVPQDQESE